MKKQINVFLGLAILLSLSSGAFAAANYATNTTLTDLKISYQFVNPNLTTDVTTTKTATISSGGSVNMGVAPDKSHTKLHIISAISSGGYRTNQNSIQTNYSDIDACSTNTAGQTSDHDFLFSALYMNGRVLCEKVDG